MFGQVLSGGYTSSYTAGGFFQDFEAQIPPWVRLSFQYIYGTGIGNI